MQCCMNLQWGADLVRQSVPEVVTLEVRSAKHTREKEVL